jgi:hypothetical protein
VAQTDSATPDPSYISTNFYKRYGRYRRCRQDFCRKGFCVDTSSEEVSEVPTPYTENELKTFMSRQSSCSGQSISCWINASNAPRQSARGGNS